MAGMDTVSRPIYDRKYAPLKRFSWAWRSVATYFSFMTWLASTPWLAIRAIAPANFQDNLQDIENSFFSFVTPIVNFIQDSSYKVFNLADSSTDWFINTSTHIYHNNLKGFEHTFNHFLNNIEHRVNILKNDGLNGIGKALSFDISSTPSGAPISSKLPTPVAHALGTEQPIREKVY